MPGSTTLTMTCHLLGLLLVALLFVSEVHSLKCYDCSPTINKTECNVNGLTPCPYGPSGACATFLVYKGSAHIVAKYCLPKADCDALEAFEGAYGGATLDVTCCQSDGCNVNAAPRPLGAAHVTLALLGVATSVVVSRALV